MLSGNITVDIDCKWDGDFIFSFDNQDDYLAFVWWLRSNICNAIHDDIARWDFDSDILEITFEWNI